MRHLSFSLLPASPAHLRIFLNVSFAPSYRRPATKSAMRTDCDDVNAKGILASSTCTNAVMLMLNLHLDILYYWARRRENRRIRKGLRFQVKRANDPILRGGIGFILLFWFNIGRQTSVSCTLLLCTSQLNLCESASRGSPLSCSANRLPLYALLFQMNWAWN